MISNLGTTLCKFKPLKCRTPFILLIFTLFYSILADPCHAASSRRTAEGLETLKIWKNTESCAIKMNRSELTVYPASQENNTGIGIIICPGGSYCYLGMNVEGRNTARWLQKQGISAFVLRYRVGMFGNHHPAMIQDLQRALQLVRENDSMWQITKVGVMGFSAGGHLVGTSALYYDENFMESLGIRPSVSLRPDFVAMIYPVVSMDDSLAHRKSRKNLLGKAPDSMLVQKMCLEKNLRPDLPPLFLLQCLDDPTVNYLNAVVLDQEMQKRNLPHTFYLFQHGGHGFGIQPRQETDSKNWKDKFLLWLKDLQSAI